MEKNKYKKTLMLVFGLTIISGGMFGYQNFYLDKQNVDQVATIYVAKEDITARTKITKELFQEVQIDSDGVLNAYVTNIDKVVGKEMKGALLRGEPLTSVRLTSEEYDFDSNLVIHIEPDYHPNIKAGDIVNSYVVLTSRNSGEVTVKMLFDSKKVYASNAVDGDGKLFINVSEEELKSYYDAKTRGKIVVARQRELDVKKEATGEAGQVDGKYDPNSEEAQSSYIPTDGSDNSVAVMKYTVQESDTLESITVKFKTSAQVLSDLNEGKTDFKAGDSIRVPAI